jgi:hypothetical protein
MAQLNNLMKRPDGDLCRGVLIFNSPGEEDLTALISSACAGSLQVARDLWGLPPPRDCRIYVMTSWWQIFNDATPWYLKPSLIVSMPFWLPPLRRVWPMAGALTLKMRVGKRVTIGIKPPRLIQSADTKVGTILYVHEADVQVKLRHMLCHELTHACSAYLRLPPWLNEGIAMHSVDHYLGKHTISAETLALLRAGPPRCAPPGFRRLTRLDAGGMALHVARGYWLVDLLETTRPGFLKGLFTSRKRVAELETRMADLLGLRRDHFWQQVDDLIIKSHP